MAFLTAYWHEIIFCLTGIALKALWDYFKKKRIHTKNLLEAEETTKIEHIVDERVEKQLKEIKEDLEEVRTLALQNKDESKQFKKTVVSSYQYKFVKLCEIYLDHGQITATEYGNLLDFFETYSALGGNGKAKEYFDRVKSLPIIK